MIVLMIILILSGILFLLVGRHIFLHGEYDSDLTAIAASVTITLGILFLIVALVLIPVELGFIPPDPVCEAI